MVSSQTKCIQSLHWYVLLQNLNVLLRTIHMRAWSFPGILVICTAFPVVNSTWQYLVLKWKFTNSKIEYKYISIYSTFCIIMNGVSNFFFFIKKRIQQPQTDLDKKTTSRQIVETRRRPDFVVCKIFISNLKYWSENVVLVNCFCFTMNLRLEVILRMY